MDFGIWFLMGAALVFFMQCGFAMLEAGFTRAKNAANIIMKNLADFSLGSLFFALIGFSIMCAEDYLFGFIGVPNLGIFNDFNNFDYSGFIFNLVFCATAATIVSGAMAERTKFTAYCIYSVIISAVIYPIEAGWVWNGNGWLANLGFIDFAGSAAIHMVGGISGFIGAAVLGPRIGKYSVDAKTGKKTAHAIPGHSITLGALGCFILWFGWYGFNGAAAGNLPQLGSIFLTTTLSPATAAVAAMFLTWFKNGKPDVSMSLNGALAGLVAITAPCSNVDALGAILIGLVAGILVVLAIEFIDLKLHVDDPVGAVAVHGVCGVWGALAVGLFAKPIVAITAVEETVTEVVNGLVVVSDKVTEVENVISEAAGLFYGGGFELLGIQALGVLTIAAWTFVTVGATFLLLKKFNLLRAPKEDEIKGLDSTEHGLISGYADFMIMADEADSTQGLSPVSANEAIPVVNNSNPNAKMSKVVIITKQDKFEQLKWVLDKIGITGMTVTQVLGCGMQKGAAEYYRGVQLTSKLLPKVKVEIVVSKVPVEQIIGAVRKALYTGNIGDGKIFVYGVENVIKVRTGEEGYDALQDKD
ncbi:MAG: ammonium transporter [Chitinivibrionia bacterium]|jgi:Amt family ammonium transporter|nr:ammonium transporter [Chitinivibrionia bacterium]